MSTSPPSPSNSAAELKRLRARIKELELRAELARQHEVRMSRHNSVIMGLSRSRAIGEGNVEVAIPEITRTVAESLDVERVSVWLFNDDQTKIRCLDLFERSRDRHSSGQELTAEEHPDYFRALREDRTIAAHDARVDPRTSGFIETYLDPLGITSMLDAMIGVGGRSIGVICHEHTGPRRTWTLEDQAFAGSIADFVAITLEAHERRLAQQALAEQQAYLRQILDINPTLIFAKDREGRFTLVNKALADIYGTTVKEMMGKTDADFEPNLEEVEFFLQIDREVMNTLREHRVPEERITDSHGNLHWMQTVKRPIIGADGVSNQVLGVATDITERKEIERALRDSKERYRVIAETATDAIVAIDEESRILFANAATERIFGYARDDLLDQSITMLMPEAMRPRHLSSLERYLKTGHRSISWSGIELTGRHENGREIPLEVSFGEQLTDGTRILTGIIRDVTERRQAQERQRLMVRELDHRVKNNMAVMLAIAEQTALGCATIEDFFESFGGRIRSVAVAHELLSQTSWQGAELGSLVNRILDPFQGDDAGRITVDGQDLTLPANVAPVMCMVLHELASNAAKYGALSGADGGVDITWTRDGAGTDSDAICLHWREHGGPTVSPPTRSGFGIKLIRRMIAHQLGGEAELQFDSDGVRCRIHVPLSYRVSEEIADEDAPENDAREDSHQ